MENYYKILQRRRLRQEKLHRMVEQPIIGFKKPFMTMIEKYIALGLATILIFGSVGGYLNHQFNTQNQRIAQLEKTIENNQEVIAMQTNLNQELKNELLSSRIVITQEERELLERLVEAEAGSEPYEGKIAVANVVFNRVNNPYYPDTITEVVFQPFQFTPAHNGRINGMKPSSASIRAVEEVLHGKKVVPDKTLFFVSLSLATDFTVPNTRPRITSIGNHTFYQ